MNKEFELKSVIISILAKNDVGKSLSSTIGLNELIDDLCYVSTDATEPDVTLSLSPFQDKIKKIMYINNTKALQNLAELKDNYGKEIKEQIIVIDHIGSLINMALAECNIDWRTNPMANYVFGGFVLKVIEAPIIELIANARKKNKVIVFLVPISYESDDDLKTGKLAFDTKTAQNSIFNLSDFVVHLKRKSNEANYNTIDNLFDNLQYVFSHPHATCFPLKDKMNIKNKKAPNNKGILYNLLYKIFKK